MSSTSPPGAEVSSEPRPAPVGPRIPTSRPGPEGGTRDTNRKARIAQITQAALQLFLERSIEGVTIDDVTRAAGIAKGSFYRYFDSREALVQSIITPLEQRVTATLNTCEAALREATDPAALYLGFLAMALDLAQVLQAEPDVVRLYLQESRGPAFGDRRAVRALADRVVLQAIAITTAARSHGMLRDVPGEVSALAVVGAVERLLFEYLGGRMTVPAETIAQSMVTLILDGVVARPTP